MDAMFTAVTTIRRCVWYTCIWKKREERRDRHCVCMFVMGSISDIEATREREKERERVYHMEKKSERVTGFARFAFTTA